MALAGGEGLPVPGDVRLAPFDLISTPALRAGLAGAGGSCHTPATPFLNATRARGSLAGSCHNHPQRSLQVDRAEAGRLCSVGTRRWHRRPDCRRAAAAAPPVSTSGRGNGQVQERGRL
ncbi:hypothetical protein DV515_00010844 [Chloebia gouldiae]|uniref:Uncharacterized protein n=1 Tax=Chloebia gouldiae TaxID=44316 RepID=A0A3L8S967_CHLGU|nr:hypothetical protein DV515_00010844 [Chloebia gouldiae]